MTATERRVLIEQLRRFRIGMIFHTHWDREWYSTATVYQHRAVEFMERVFEVHGPGSRFPAFYLDGQTCLLDDYLALRPSNRERLQRMIRAGRLQVGPWYVMPEEHQPSAESHLRNLETGLRRAAEFGDRAEKVGYLADPITYIPQMPQLLRGYGIRLMVHGRGITRQYYRGPQEQEAVAPDGSHVFLYKLPFSYYMDFGMTYAAFRERFFLFAQRNLIPSSSSGLILLMSGGDQLYPTGRELGFIDRLRRETGIRIEPTTLPEFLKTMQRSKRPRERVEREGPWSAIQDIFSTRIPLKRRIKTAERRLERATEPLVALAALLGADPQADLMRELWRRNSENMFHDSIYGAHADAVTREIEMRCTQLDELTERAACVAAYEASRRLPALARAARAAVPSYALWNTTGVTVEGLREIELYTDTPGPRRLADRQGREIPALLLSERTGPSFLTERGLVDSQVNQPPPKTWQTYLVKLPELAPFSPLLFTARPARARWTTRAVNPHAGWANHSFRLILRGRRLVLKWGGIERPLRFRVQGDAGDQYMFRPDGPREELFCTRVTARRTGPFSEWSFTMVSRARRLRIEGLARMHAESPELHLRFAIHNDDRAFRLTFEMDALAPGRHTAHTPYAWVERHDEPTADIMWATPGFQVRFPLVEFVGVNGARSGLNVFTPDITHYRIDDANNLVLAMLRSVSRLSSVDAPAGPPMPTPDAELRGTSVFDLTLVPCRMTPEEQMRTAWRRHSPLTCFPLSVRERSNVAHPERPVSRQTGRLRFPLLETDRADALISAFRCIPWKRGQPAWVARVVNLSRAPLTCRLKTGFDFSRAVQTDFRQRAVRPLEAGRRRVKLALRPAEIATVLFTVP